RPALRGEARWVSRSTVVFAPAPSAWTPGVREVRLGFVGGLTSLGGEALVDDLERVLVLDGAPRVSPYRSQGRVAAGAPLPLYFDAPVQPGSLRQELLAYEIGGGHRSVPITLTAARQQPEDGYRVDVRLRRALEPGARIGLALAPRYLPWGGSSPAVMSYELAPRPHIEGVGCQEGAAYLGQCDHRGSPGEIVSIGPSLRLLSSARLAGASVANFRVRPAVRDLRVRLAPHGPPQHRLVELSGEWEPDQVYEVRVSGLRTEEGEVSGRCPRWRCGARATRHRSASRRGGSPTSATPRGCSRSRPFTRRPATCSSAAWSPGRSSPRSSPRSGSSATAARRPRSRAWRPTPAPTGGAPAATRGATRIRPRAA
ncbi:MAG: hypothetical protein RID93_17325, partial [Sandaracinaceae bacterium]